MQGQNLKAENKSKKGGNSLMRAKSIFVLMMILLMAGQAMADPPTCPKNKPNAIINPGNQDVNEGTVVTLDGTNSNPKGQVICQWTSETDPNIVITNANSCTATFTAPEVVGPNGTHFVFRLDITQNITGCPADTDSKTTTINVMNVVPANRPPVANATASPNPANEGDVVTLNGSGSSDPEGQALTYKWEQLSGTPVSLENDTGAVATFTAPNDAYPNGEALTFKLTVSDGSLSGSTEIIVNITWVNDPPKAIISCPTTIDERESLTLYGHASTDIDDGIASYAWIQAQGEPNADLTEVDLTDADITFYAPTLTSNLKTMKFKLTVTDNGGLQDSAECDIEVLDITPPVISGAIDITAEATSSSGAAVSFNITATDAVDGEVDVTCTPPSSSTFALGITSVTCSASDLSGNNAKASFNVNVVDTTPPDISDVQDMSVFATSASGAVVTYTNPTANDIVDGSVPVTCSPASGSTFAIGKTTVTCSATDAHGNTASKTFTIAVIYKWSGFFQPVDNLPALNSVKAGSAIPIKFSLGGSMGLEIFAPGYPKSVDIVDQGATGDDIEETVNAGGSSLTYDPTANQYVYVWKTNKSWSGTSRQLQVQLKDGTLAHLANFKFK
jgi:hypothetical protein